MSNTILETAKEILSTLRVARQIADPSHGYLLYLDNRKTIQIRMQEYLAKYDLLYKNQSGTDFISRGMDESNHSGMILVML